MPLKGSGRARWPPLLPPPLPLLPAGSSAASGSSRPRAFAWQTGSAGSDAPWMPQGCGCAQIATSGLKFAQPRAALLPAGQSRPLRRLHARRGWALGSTLGRNNDAAQQPASPAGNLTGP